MPYKKNSDLPPSVRNHLPVKAQTIYMKSFNNALDHYHDETIAIKVAWSAVKNQYEKGDEGMWKLK